MTDIKGKYCSLTFLNLSAYSWLVAKMPEILTYNTPPNIEKGKTKQSIFKSFFDSFNSKDKFTKLSLITFALIIIATPFIIANRQIFTPRAATTGDTLDLIVSDMTQPHMGHVLNTTGYDWELRPVLQGVAPRGTHTASWAMLDWDDQHDSGSPGMQIEVQDFKTYGLVNGTWQQINSGIYGSQINDPNFGPNIYGDAGAGPIFNAPPHGKGIQFYQGFATYPAGMTGVWASYRARLVTDDGVAFLIANVGGDWATMNPFNDLGSMGVGRLKRLTSDWQWFNLSTVPETVLRSNPPPGLDTVTVSSPTPTPLSLPTPTPPQATTTPTLTPLNSFNADYFNNQTLSGSPAYSTNTTSINYNWGTGSPTTGVSADHFSARYTGSFNFDGSTYKFNATSDDGIRVYLDGQVIIDAWKDQGPTAYSVSKTPTAGNHTVTVEYYENSFGATLVVNWAKVAVPTPTPLLADTDKDGFSDKIEAYIGTDPFKVCGKGAWPPDIDGDQAVSILDISNAANSYNTKAGDLKYNKRYDMDTDGAIGIADLNIIASYFLQRCTTPVMAPLASRPDVNQFIAVTSKVIEAETFKLNSGYADPGKNIFSDTTASGGKGFILWSPGSAQTVTSNGFSKATFRVKADVCQGGPKLTIKIDGKILYSQDFVSTSWTDITVNFAAVAGTNHTILVELANDRYSAGICDRNLRFDKVTLL